MPSRSTPLARRSGRFVPAVLLPTLLSALLAGCGTSGTTFPGTPEPAEPGGSPASPVPALGTTASLDLVTWNIEWFGHPEQGPEDEEEQLARVRDVILGTDADIWSFQEVVDGAAFDRLLAELPGYDGFLANESAVTNGAAWYSDFDDTELKVGLIWKTEVAEIRGARVVLNVYDHAFAGRPPVEVRVRLRRDRIGGTAGREDAVLVLLHAKAGADVEDWERRHAGATALEGWLDTNWPDEEVWVLGDFNDDVDASIVDGRPSPYARFVDATDSWTFTTASISASGSSSTVFWPDVIDHHLASDEAAAWLVPGTATAYRVDRWIDDYPDTTSDHYPVVVRYRPGG